ncbi:MAG: tRNA uridine-5-carboxymethylaminomethyl(34) synthesis GTPase MnmE [bacterium]|nr:tRNA uridine-5-carboxymethylaminomethyl(34) synthesis GTPase MnmE [bacterium]
MAKAFSRESSCALAGGDDTIVASATAPGRGALAVVRASGPNVRELAAKVFPGLDFTAPWKAQLVTAVNAFGADLEQCVAIPYNRPRSYTGEDMIDVMVHGSTRLVSELIEVLVSDGIARMAEAGEFTRRAVVNQKIDLVQAEAVFDLIAAESARQLEAARWQRSGELSHVFRRLREEVLSLWAELEAGMEFVAQGVEVEVRELERRQEEALHDIDDLLATAHAGEMIRAGVSVAIVGPPNSGKSTLFNSLLGKERAITSEQPGTTRDTVSAEVELDGLAVQLVDTAGLRVSEDTLEHEGMARAHMALAEADLAILLVPVTEAVSAFEIDLPQGLQVIKVRSKGDLHQSGDPTEEGWLRVSAASGDGLDELCNGIVRVVLGSTRESGIVIARRHRECLERARNELVECDFCQFELAAERIRWAAAALAELIGEVDDEAVLDRVFSSFCVGK